MSQQPITSCHNVPAVVVGGDEGTNHYECPVCHEPVNIDGSNPSQQPDHFTSMPDDQFKKRLKQTAEQSDELTQPWPVACEKCNGLRKEYPSTPEYGVYSQHYNYHVEPSEQPDKELDDIKLSIRFTERQLDDMKPGDEIELGLTDEAKQRLNALIEKKVREARVDELENLPWKRADKYGINTPYVTKKWLRERLAELQDNQAKEDV